MNDRSGKALAGIIFLMMLAGGSSVASDLNDGNVDDGSDGGGDGSEPDPGGDGPPEPECSDGIDNDGDGLIDEEDPQCDPNDPNFNEMEA